MCERLMSSDFEAGVDPLPHRDALHAVPNCWVIAKDELDSNGAHMLHVLTRLHGTYASARNRLHVIQNATNTDTAGYRVMRLNHGDAYVTSPYDASHQEHNCPLPPPRR